MKFCWTAEFVVYNMTVCTLLWFCDYWVSVILHGVSFDINWNKINLRFCVENTVMFSSGMFHCNILYSVISHVWNDSDPHNIAMWYVCTEIKMLIVINFLFNFVMFTILHFNCLHYFSIFLFLVFYGKFQTFIAIELFKSIYMLRQREERSYILFKVLDKKTNISYDSFFNIFNIT